MYNFFSVPVLFSALTGWAVLFPTVHTPHSISYWGRWALYSSNHPFLSTIKPTDNLTDLSHGGLVLSVVLGLLRRKQLIEVPTHYLTWNSSLMLLNHFPSHLSGRKTVMLVVFAMLSITTTIAHTQVKDFNTNFKNYIFMPSMFCTVCTADMNNALFLWCILNI